MEYVLFIIFLAVLKESHPLNPGILKYDQYMKDFEVTGRQMKQEAKYKEMDGLVIKRESHSHEIFNVSDVPIDDPNQEQLEQQYLEYYGISEYERFMKRLEGVFLEYHPGKFREEEYTVGEIDTEKLFQKFQPDAKNISSEWVDALTPESLQRICDEVLEQVRRNELSGFIKEYKYTHVNASDLMIERVIKNTPYFSFLSGEMENITVAYCPYDNYQFYITRADDNNAFRLWRDGGGVLAMKSGAHPVHFK